MRNRNFETTASLMRNTSVTARPAAAYVSVLWHNTAGKDVCNARHLGRVRHEGTHSMSTPRFGRMITAMVTPFTPELDLDLGRAQQLALKLLDEGSDALVVCGTTGETPTVFYPQKLDLFRAVIEAVDGRAPIIANAGDNCTADSVEFAQDVAALGVDAIMAVVPYYNKPPQEGLYRHFRTIAESVDLPVILYNIPGRSVINMTVRDHASPGPRRLQHRCGQGGFRSMTQIAELTDGAPDGFEVLRETMQTRCLSWPSAEPASSQSSATSPASASRR